MTELTLPRLAEGMTEGTVLTWIVGDGAVVAEGDEIAEIETDKAVVALAAPAAGVVNVVAPAGTKCAVGALLATIGSAPPASAASAAPSPAASPPAASPPAALPPLGGGVTPLARRTAAGHGVSLDGLTGSGPRGRVTRADVLAAAGVEVAPPTPPAAPAPARAPGGLRGESVSQPLTRLRRTVADRMRAAKATVPHFQVQADAAVDALLEFRSRLPAVAGGPGPTITDLLVKASALALRDVPIANASFGGDAVELHGRVNIGVAVATDRGLLVPTILDADVVGLGTIAATARRLAARAREGTITAEELDGATFTISNLGMYGMSAITPIVNPPQVAILGVGAAREVVALDDDGQPYRRQLLTLTLSCDHRVLDGIDGARLLGAIRSRIEDPMALAL